MEAKYNSVKLGVILGMILPIISLLIFYFLRFNTISFVDFISHSIDRNVHTHLISLCVIPNLLLFFIFIWLNKLYSARGVIFATLVYTFAVFGIKFLS